MRPDASVVGSVHTLLPFFLLGVVLGVCFDVFRVLRLWRHGGKNRAGGKFTSSLLRAKMRRAILKEKATGAFLKKLFCVCDDGLIIEEDVLFCLAAAVFYLLLQYDINSGVFRWYLLALCALGFWLYLATLGKGTMRVALFLTALVRFVLLFFYNHTVYYCMLGFVYAFRKIGSAVHAVFRHACAAAREKKAKKRARTALAATEALAANGFLYDDSRRKRQGGAQNVYKAKAGKAAANHRHAEKETGAFAPR